MIHYYERCKVYCLIYELGKKGNKRSSGSFCFYLYIFFQEETKLEVRLNDVCKKDKNETGLF